MRIESEDKVCHNCDGLGVVNCYHNSEQDQNCDVCHGSGQLGELWVTARFTVDDETDLLQAINDWVTCDNSAGKADAILHALRMSCDMLGIGFPS